jgi:hypothetical protein
MSNNPLSYWAIRRKSDGAFMPAGRSKGFTFDEPEVLCLPRLFRRKRDAKSALGYWLAGELHADYGSSGYLDLLGDMDERDVCDLRVVKRDDRVAEDMEIARVGLTVYSE